MAPFRETRKRCASGSSYASSRGGRRGTSRTGSTGSSTHSRPQTSRSVASYGTYTGSIRGLSHRRSSNRPSTTASARPVSVATTRTFGGDFASRTGASTEALPDELPDAETLSEAIMAVDLTDRGNIGCAYYVARTETLYFMEDVRLGDAEMVDACEFLDLSR